MHEPTPDEQDYHLYIPGMIIVGWVILNQDNRPVRPQAMKRWYDEAPKPGPAKIYATRDVAKRYGKPWPVYIPNPEDD